MDHDRRFTREKITRQLELITGRIERCSKSLAAARVQGPCRSGGGARSGGRHRRPGWALIEPNTYWGDWDTTFTLRTHFSVPEGWSSAGPVAVALDLGDVAQWDFCHPEALAYLDGYPLIGCDTFHRRVTLPAACCDGGSICSRCTAIQAGGASSSRHRRNGSSWVRAGSCRSTPPRATWWQRRVWHLVRSMSSMATTPRGPASSPPSIGLSPSSIPVRHWGPPSTRRYQAPTRSSVMGFAAAGPALDVDITAIGHTHIDVAWLWPLAQTRLKCGRSFHTVLALMEESDDYIFTQSQPQLYDYVRHDYPQLFARIQSQVARGRWEVTGGMWVEADCNLSGPESLVRQLLLGRKFFAEHFGATAETPIAWLPDVFGFPHSLPQLLKQAGLDYFFTTKLSWNQYNRMPYDSFWWQGLDGTKILTHLGTTTQTVSEQGKPVTYNGVATPEEIYATWTNFQQKRLQHDLMTVYGFGDGGGGPTREMLENIEEMAGFPGLPRTRPGRAFDFFRKMEETVGPQLPTWNGELYLEYHRGTYTTQARNKRANRKTEFLLHDAEWLATIAARLEPGLPYPHTALREAWQLLCLNQFHDILPGSSIGEVYRESLQQYEQIERIAGDVREASLTAVAEAVAGDLIVANPTPIQQTAIAWWHGQLLPGQTLRHRNGRRSPPKRLPQGHGSTSGQCPPMPSCRSVFDSSPPAAILPPGRLQATTERLENDQLRVTLNAAGDVTAIYDKTRVAMC